MKRNALYVLEKHQNILESPTLLSEDGLILENLNIKDWPLDKESLILKKKIIIKKNQKNQDLTSCIPESQVVNNKTTYKDKNNILKKIVKPKSSPIFKILHPDLISKEKALSKFWTQSKKKEYEQLSWLPKIEWQGLDSISSNGYVTNTEQKSWFSITKINHQQTNLEKTCSPSFKFTVVGGTEKEDTKITKSLKLRIFPTKEQNKILNKWSGSSRFTYNKTIACLNNPKNNCFNWMKLRNRFVTSKTRRGTINTFFNNKQWLLETPKSIRLSSVKEATKNLKACFTNLKNKNINSFNLQFKKKKNELQNGWCIGLEKNNVLKEGDKLTIFSDSLGEIKYARKKQLHKLIEGNKPLKDPRIQKDKFGDYYILLVFEKKIKKPPKIHKTVRSYDPGVNIFLTGYDPSGEASLIGKGAGDKIISLLEELDDLISIKASKPKILKLRKRIYNLKKEMHNQVNNIVVKSSTLVLYPKLDTEKLSLKERRQLTTKTVRKMLNLGHCEAYTKLRQKCKEHGCQLLTVSEAFTTKTCCSCGNINTCSNERIYNCICGYKAERDINGAQNILLRSLES